MMEYEKMTYWQLFRNTRWLDDRAHYLIPECLSDMWNGLRALGKMLLFFGKCVMAIVGKPIATYQFYKILRKKEK